MSTKTLLSGVILAVYESSLVQKISKRHSYKLIPGLFFIVLLICSFFFVIFYSFLDQAPPRGVYEWTTTNYGRVFTAGIFRSVFWDSFIIAVKTTVGALILSYPLAYYLSFVAKRWEKLLLVLVILPIWANIVVRTYAWMQILGNRGLINYLLTDLLGILDRPIPLLFTENAVVIGLVYVFLPFMVFPIYNSLRSVDRSLIEAAKNLGANNLSAFVEITFPRSLPGVISGITIVFILSFGSFVTPLLLGGERNIMIANLIARYFGTINDWGIGSALAVVFVTIVATIVYIINRFYGLESLYGGDS